MSGPTSKTPRRLPTVLVAEDDDAIRKMIVHLLSDFAETHAVEDGVKALAFLRAAARAPDLLVTDVMMPHMDGLTLLSRIKQDEDLKRMPVIVLTAKDRPMDVVSGINAGARHYLTKPFNRDELLDKVKKALRLE